MEEAQARSGAPFRPLKLLALAALVMAYGWGYRGIVGHEGGAMVPGALLGMALCLGSGRADWYRRTAVSGLFGAAGFAWGGSLSYMEQTFYTVSGSFPDVLYGYAVLFFMGALWAGIGGAVLGLAFTLPRSALQRLAGPFTAIGAAYLAAFLYLFFDHGAADVYHRFVAQHFHDGDFFAALIALLVSAAYAAFRKGERSEALLFAALCGAWFAGYLLLTKFGGILLGPPYRSESWGGILGVLLALMFWLWRTRNRAAFLLGCYGTVGGGLAFALAVFIRHPVRVGWGPFASWHGGLQWKIAEESFGLLMGLALALGALRLLRGGLAAPAEDVPRKPLDFYAAFVVLVVLLWMNVRRAPMRWTERHDLVGDAPVAGLAPWAWFFLMGMLLTAIALYALRRYARDELALAPPTAFGKGAWLFLLLLWITAGTGFAQMLPEAGSPTYPLIDVSFFTLAGLATFLVLAQNYPAAPEPAPEESVLPSDAAWRPGAPIYVACAAAPVVLVAITLGSMAMQDGPADGARLRFGPEAFHREATAVIGRWTVEGISDAPQGEPSGPPPAGVHAIEFLRDRSAIVTTADGERIGDVHRWYHADSRIHMDWFGRLPDHPEQATVLVVLAGDRLYVPWPASGQAGQYLILSRGPK